MTLRKITIDNSVKYISKDGHSHNSKERESKPTTRKKNGANKKGSQKIQKFIRNITGEVFKILK